MQITILIDFKAFPESRFWIKVELEKMGYDIQLLGIQNYNTNDEQSKSGKLKLWIKYLKLAVSGIKKTKKNDIIISWNFVVGAMLGFICKIFNIKRKIISLNMIAHQKGFINSLFRKLVYNSAFKYSNFWFSVNDAQLIDNYSKSFHFPTERIFVLHDVFYESDEQSDYQEAGDYIFTGGDAFRDWINFIKCAEEFPGIKFVAVARKKYFPNTGKIPENLEMYFDISPEQFYSLLKGSRIVFLPLNSLAPCGLIVMIKAALLSKPVIITATPSTKNYITDLVSGKLVPMHNLSEMKKAITMLYESKEMQIEYTEHLKSHLLANFSTKANAEIIDKIIKI